MRGVASRLVGKEEGHAEGGVGEEGGQLGEADGGVEGSRELGQRLRAECLQRVRWERAVAVEHCDVVGERLKIARTG